MSEIREATISEKTSGSGVTIDSVNIKDGKVVTQDSPFRNLIINGDMSISQRGTSATTIGSNFEMNTIDRWYGMEASDGAATLERHDMSAAEKVTTGQHYALEWNCTGTDSSLASNQYAGAAYYAEAQHMKPLLYGTSSAKTFTLSFWVKSNTTGTYSIGIVKDDSTTYYHGATYAISSADTWEYKTLVITPTAGSTSLITGANGIINNDNGIGLQFFFYTALGSSFQGTGNQWSASAVFGTSDQPNLMASTSNNWYITGVQLEVGSTASDFEHLPTDVQLQRCMRYYTRYDASAGFTRYASGFINSSTAAVATMQLPVPMRGVPTLETSGSGGDYSIYHLTGTTACSTTPTIQVPSTGDDNATSVGLQQDVASGLTAGQGCIFLGTTSNTNNFFAFSSEL